MTIRFFFVAAAILLLSACVTAPKPLQGEFTTIAPIDAVNHSQVGAHVRWGGRIVETEPRQDTTCFQMISAPLNSSGRPISTVNDATTGRFIACRAGFYEPEIFAPGREVTFIGQVEGFQTVLIGEYEYRLPLLKADIVYLWPIIQDVEVRAYPYYHYYDPFWGPWWGPRWWW